MLKLAHTLLLLCLVATLAHAFPTQLTLNQAINGTVNSTNTFAEYSFQHTQLNNASYQALKVLTLSTPQFLEKPPTLDVVVSNSTWNTSLTCATPTFFTSAFYYVGMCQYSFFPCVSDASPEHYNVSITYPQNVSGTYEFQVADIQADSSLSENTNTKTGLTTCCGYQGGSWHYIYPSPQTIITEVTLTLTAGSLIRSIPKSSTGLGSVLPGIYVLPANVCTSANIPDFAQVLNETTTWATFGNEFEMYSGGGVPVSPMVTVQLDVSEKDVGYWVYVIADQNSVGIYSLTAEYQSTGSSSRLAPFFWSWATNFHLF